MEPCAVEQPGEPRATHVPFVVLMAGTFSFPKHGIFPWAAFFGTPGSYGVGASIRALSIVWNLSDGGDTMDVTPLDQRSSTQCRSV